MRNSYIVFPIIWDQEPNSVRYYLVENGARFIQIDSNGLLRLATMLPSDRVDYDEVFQPQIRGVDIL